MAASEIAYYPGETPLFDGDVAVRKVPSDTIDPQMVEVTVAGQPRLALTIISKPEYPLRTIHTGYFTRAGGSAVRICNVDLELPEQPDIETVARVMLADPPESL